MNKTELFGRLEELLETKYKEKLEKAVVEGKDSFSIDFRDLIQEDKRFLNEQYEIIANDENGFSDFITAVFNKTAIKLNLSGPLGPFYTNIYLSFTNVTPRRKIRELTSEMINGLMEVNGIIISTSSPQSIINIARFKCPKCEDILEVRQFSSELISPTMCICKNTRGFILLENDSKWDDYQEMILQEKPDEVRAGVIPRTIKIICRGKQLIDRCKPGDVVDISCSLVPIQTKKKGTRIYTQCLDANYIEQLSKESYSIELTEEDKIVLDSISTHPDLQNTLVRSVFPSIYEHNDEKLAMILAMFGGVDRKKSDISQRGTINVLLIGDPSTAKTRMLQAMTNAAPKIIYTSGMGASGVGLTAAAVQDPSGWRLEAGALVLADSGICCIDEIEKMSDEDRVKIHEAMSKQTISIDKASIHTTLNSRTTIIAAANPTHGRYDDSEYLTENVSLPPTILSRFDLIFIIRDIPDMIKDREMAETIFDVKIRPESEEIINQELLKKYVLYSKQTNPTLPSNVINKILDFYIPLRQQSMNIANTPIAIAPRQLEGLRRLTEARARMYLRKEATLEDADNAIELMTRSLEKAGYDPKTGKIDIMISEAGKPLSKEIQRKNIITILEGSVGPVTIEEIMDMCESSGLFIEKKELISILNKLIDQGFMYHPEQHLWVTMTNINTYKEG
jgi:replicative DNA helicase Mcm